MKKLLLLVLNVGCVFAVLPPQARVKELIFTKKCVDAFCAIERQELEKEYGALTSKKKLRPESSSAYSAAHIRYNACLNKNCMTTENVIAPMITKIITMASDAAKANVDRELMMILSVYNQYESSQIPDHYIYFLKYFSLASPEQRIQIIKNKTNELPQNVVYMMAALMHNNPIEFIKTYRLSDKPAWMGALIAEM